MNLSKRIGLVCLVMLNCLTTLAVAQDAAARAPAVSSPRDVNPTLITLHLKNAPFAGVMAEIAKQSGTPINLNGPSNVPVTIDVDQKPFWEVLSAVCDQAQAGVQAVSWNGPHLQVNVGFATPKQRRVISGPMMATFSHIEHLNQLTAPQAARDFADVQVNVMWEPRLALAYYEMRSIPTVAVDENGLSLVPGADVHDPRTWDTTTYQSPQIENGMGPSFQHSIYLKIPPQSGRHIAHLTGQIRAWVTDKTEQVTIPNLAAAAKKNPTLTVPNSKIQFKLSNVYAQAQWVQMQMSLPPARADLPDDLGRQRYLMNGIKATVFDADGKAWSEPVQARDFGNQEQIYLQIQRRTDVTTAPKKAVLDVPVSAAEIDIPYDLNDLPLP